MTKLTEQLFEGTSYPDRQEEMDRVLTQVTGVNVLLEEVLIRIKPPSRRTVITYSTRCIDLNDYDFWTIRVTLLFTGEQWSIHLCGPQYGMRRPGSLWVLFEGYKIYKILDVKPLGTLAAHAAVLAQTKGTDGLKADMQIKAMQAFHDAWTRR
jgi:hypothetical protein